MASDENREQENSSSDKSRIKNITNKVHPEYAASRKSGAGTKTSGAARRSAARPSENTRRRSSESGDAGAHTQKAEAARRRKESAERKRRIRRRRRMQRMTRALGLCLVIVAVVVTVWVVRNYNSGSRHDSSGMNAYENGDYDTAISEFKEALSYDGQNADYYIHLGMAYIEQQAYDEALGYFNQAESCAEEDDQTALLNRGRGIACLYEGDYASAITWFETALDASEQSRDVRIDTLYYKAEAENKAGDYTAAVDTYGQIITLQDDAGARMLRGMVYMSLEDYASAETDLYEAVSQSRKSYAIYRALYSALTAQGKDEEAREVLSEALELSGSSGEDYFNRGMIYLDLQDYTQAAEMLNTAYDKGYEAALLGLGEAAVSQEDYETAMGYYETYFSGTDADSTDSALAARAYNQYALCLMAGGDYEKAAEACENGLKYNDRDVDAALSFNLIVSYEHLGRWEDAWNMAKTYVSKYPEDEEGQKEYAFLESRVAQ